MRRFCFSSGWNHLIGPPCSCLEETMRCDRLLTIPTIIKLSRCRLITGTRTLPTPTHTHTETHVETNGASAFHQDNPPLLWRYPSAACCFFFYIFFSVSPLLLCTASLSFTPSLHVATTTKKKVPILPWRGRWLIQSDAAMAALIHPDQQKQQEVIESKLPACITDSTVWQRCRESF